VDTCQKKKKTKQKQNKNDALWIQTQQNETPHCTHSHIS
jgi:hypothetical protein